MKTKTQSWILEWFQNRNPEIVIDVEQEYYSQKLIDSFGVIELIHDLEKHFSIVFDDSDFQQLSFRTIKGLAQLIDSKNQNVT